jgi:putative membrane protein insertion efficiency factor
MKTFVRLLQRIYKLTLSPLLHWIAGPGSGCRFQPSCSEYFAEAVETHGIFRGTRLGVVRICRCNPWCTPGYDPVPPVQPAPHESQKTSR